MNSRDSAAMRQPEIKAPVIAAVDDTPVKASANQLPDGPIATTGGEGFLIACRPCGSEAVTLHVDAYNVVMLCEKCKNRVSL